MRTIETTIYQFNELNDAAKERARYWYKSIDPFAWSDAYVESINAFCRHFGVTMKDWSVEPFGFYEYKTDATNANFRGIKLRDIDRDNMPTGFCADCALWETFYDVFKRTGDALRAFNDALDAGFHAWRADWEYSYSDEAIDESIEANEYEFTEDGERV